MVFIQEKIMHKCVKFLILLIIPFTISCKMKNNQDKNEDYEVYVDEVVRDFVKEAQKEYGLKCIGSGGSMPHDVAEIGVMFTIQKKITSVEEARELEVAAIQKLLHHINNHSKIRPFLREYPFHNDRVSISISFTDRKNHRYTDGRITRVHQARNRIFYCTAKEYLDKGYRVTDPETNEVLVVPDRKGSKLVDYYNEPYEEALKKIKSLPKR